MLKKNGVLFDTPTVFIPNNTLPISHSVTMTGSDGTQTYYYSYNQYMCNANISFQTTYENITNTYTVSFSITGMSDFFYNTTVSSIWHR